jgi:hypothetical protein
VSRASAQAVQNGGKHAPLPRLEVRPFATGPWPDARQDGSLDASFGTGSTVTTDFAGGGDRASALVVQADGRLVAVGGESPDQSEVSADFALARYRAS